MTMAREYSAWRKKSREAMIGVVSGETIRAAGALGFPAGPPDRYGGLSGRVLWPVSMFSWNHVGPMIAAVVAAISAVVSVVAAMYSVRAVARAQKERRVQDRARNIAEAVERGNVRFTIHGSVDREALLLLDARPEFAVRWGEQMADVFHVDAGIRSLRDHRWRPHS